MFVLFESVCEIDAAPVVTFDCPVTFALAATVQVYVVLAGTISVPFAGVTVNVASSQIVAVVFAITGVGLTVTETVNGVPEHEFVNVAGVMV